jgi:hypothetical protein
MFFAYMLLSLAVNGQALDTAVELKKLVSDFKSLKNMSYDYEMDIKFPDGQKDHVKGMTYLNSDDRLYYNDCDAFVMIYTQHWFYKADHRKKTLTIVNMDRDYDKRLKKATEKDIFQNGAVAMFLDSVLLKTATIKKMMHSKDTLVMVLDFPKRTFVKTMHIVFDLKSRLPAEYDMVVYHPWQKTPKGVQAIETRIQCSHFMKPDKTITTERDFFSYENGRFELKKYNNYKFSTKM